MFRIFADKFNKAGRKAYADDPVNLKYFETLWSYPPNDDDEEDNNNKS